MKRHRLRITRHSALLLGLRRLLFGPEGNAAVERPRPPGGLEPPFPPPVVVPEPGPAGGTNGNGSTSTPGTGGNTGGNGSTSTPGTGAPAGDPTYRDSLWIFAGLIVLGALTITASLALSKGGMYAVNIPNIPYFLAAIVAVVALSLHIYTFRVWIWPPMMKEIDKFPATRFGGPYVTMGFYRTVWNFFTVAWLGTIILLFFFTFGDIIPYVVNIVYILIAYWIGILIVMFLVTWLSLPPGESYFKTMIKAFQWVFVLALVILMYWGTKV